MTAPRVRRSRRSSSQTVRCRPATLHDYGAIQALVTRYGLTPKSFEHWSHIFWMGNPVRRSTPELPIGWVLEDGENQIVGSMGHIPFRFELNGRPLLVATGANWVVDERYRGYSPLLFDRFLSQPGIDLHLCTSPSEDAERTISLHCERVPAGAWDRAGYWITNPWGSGASALAKLGVPYRELLRYPAGAAMLIRDLLKRDTLKLASDRRRDYEIRVGTTFDGRFDEFWQEMRERHTQRLLNTHSREVLEWHFKYPVAEEAVWVSSVHDGARMVAYGVFIRRDAPKIGLRRVRLLDFQALDERTAWLPQLLAHEIERCRHDAIDMLENIGWGLEPGDVIDRLAPYSRRLTGWKYFYRALTPALAAELRNPSVWNPSQFDGNECL